jgi:hypothetical protein
MIRAMLSGLTSKLPGTQHLPRSGFLLLGVRAERKVGDHLLRNSDFQ